MISSQNCDHWTRASMATSGSTMKIPPSSGGHENPPGKPDSAPAHPRLRGAGAESGITFWTVTVADRHCQGAGRNPAAAKHLLALGSGDQFDELAANAGWVAAVRVAIG